MNSIIEFYKRRFKEKSTWYGLIFGVVCWGLWLEPDTHKAIVAILVTILNLIDTAIKATGVLTTNLASNKEFITGIGAGIITYISIHFIHKKEDKDK